MYRKSKAILLCCLIAVSFFISRSVLRTYAYFTDSQSYCFLIYPYDGSGECSLSFSDGSTIRACDPGTVTLQYAFINPFPVYISDLEILLILPDGTTQTSHERNLEPGETREAAFNVSLTPEMLTSQAGDPDGRFKKIQCRSTVKEYSETKNAVPQEIQGTPLVNLLYVYPKGDDPQ